MIDFPDREQFENTSGLIDFIWAPIRDVVELPLGDILTINDDPTFVQGRDWRRGYSVLDELEFEEQEKIEDIGPAVNYSFAGIIPKVEPAIVELFQNMQHSYHIIKTLDANGIQRLVGTKERPLSFTWSLSHGKGRSRNHIEYRFTGSGTSLSFIYPDPNDPLSSLAGDFNDDFNNDFF
jgi:hypothetical protein